MSKLLAMLFLLVLSAVNQLGNFYITYGLWPKSWTSFIAFWFTGMIIVVLMSFVGKEK